MTTGKTIALTKRTFVGKVMSLLLNMLSRLVITFLPRSKRLLISWLQSPCAEWLNRKWKYSWISVKIGALLLLSSCNQNSIQSGARIIYLKTGLHGHKPENVLLYRSFIILQFSATFLWLICVLPVNKRYHQMEINLSRFFFGGGGGRCTKKTPVDWV